MWLYRSWAAQYTVRPFNALFVLQVVYSKQYTVIDFILI